MWKGTAAILKPKPAMSKSIASRSPPLLARPPAGADYLGDLLRR